MFGTIIKDFFTILFILLLGFLSGFTITITKDDYDIDSHIRDIKRDVASEEGMVLDEFEGRVNLFIADRFDGDSVHITFPFSYVRSVFWIGDLRIHNKGHDFTIMIDGDNYIDIDTSTIYYDDLVNLKTGKLIHLKSYDENDVFLLWRSSKKWN